MKKVTAKILSEHGDLKVLSFSEEKGEGIFIPADKLKMVIHSAKSLHECLASPANSENAIQAAIVLDQLKSRFKVYSDVVGPIEAGLYDDEAMKKLFLEMEECINKLRGPEPPDAA